jgi:hypothetical protein
MDMERIIAVNPLENYQVKIMFEDMTEYTINVQPFISNGISEKLKDQDFFKTVKLDEFGGICWDNGFDFCPNYLRELSNNQLNN